MFEKEAKLARSVRFPHIAFNDQDSYAPDALAEFLGLNDCEGSFEDANSTDDTKEILFGGYNINSLAVLNDLPTRCDIDFKRVAAFIRENAQYIFKHNDINPTAGTVVAGS